MACLSLSLLGLFQAKLDGKPATGFKSDKVRALLAYLAVEADRPHHRETLANLLWPDWPDRAALSNLRYSLSNLRQAIGDRRASPPFLLVTPDTIQFNLASDHWMDVSAFLQLAKQAQGTAADSIVALEQATALYQGEFLSGFSVKDSHPFGEWALLKREQLHRQMLAALFRLTNLYELLGDYEPAQAYARRQVELEPWNEEAHQQLMRVLALGGQRSAALAQYAVCRRLLADELAVEPSEETTALYQNIRDGTLSRTAPAQVRGEEPPEPGEPPYKGLQYFSETDAAIFFGREALIAKLVQRLCEELTGASPDHSPWGGRFLAIIGASGSGKSSLLRAGLVPALKRGEPLADGTLPPTGSPGWLVHIITPTAHPLDALAASLRRGSESVSAAATLADELRRDPRSLHLYVQKMLSTYRPGPGSLPAELQAGNDRMLLLVVDQFEELFTLCSDDAERFAFIDNLLTAAGISKPELRANRTIILIALRADFYSHCTPYSLLRQALSRRQEYIGLMSADELRQAIEKPATRGGWIIEPGLVDLMLRDAGDEPGNLPLLSHSLLETWKRRRGRMLTLNGYTESGGVHGAIAQTADSTFHRLLPEQRLIARGIFLRLTEPGEGAQDTRRRVPLVELFSTPNEAPAVDAVLKTLIDARLVMVCDGSAEVAHEALIREWPALREWLDEDRQGLRLRRRITEAAEEWERLERDIETLYGGLRLAQALEWAENHPGGLNSLEQAFLEASKSRAEQEIAEHELQQQRELEAARKLAESERQRAEEQTRLSQRLRQDAIILTVALILTGLLAVAALVLGRQSQEKARLAASRELAAEALSNLDLDPELSAWLAIHAVSKADTPQAENALHRAVQALRAVSTLRGHASDVWSVDFSSDGRRLATAGADQTARVWDFKTGKELLSLQGHTYAVIDIAFSPDDTMLATTSDDWTTRVWDAHTGQELLSLDEPYGGRALAFNPDGKQLATCNGDEAVSLWNLNHTEAGMQAIKVYKFTHHLVRWLAFSPDGARLASGSDDGIVKIWDTANGTELFAWTADEIGVWGLAFSPDGKKLAVGGDSLVKLWDVSTDVAPVQAALTLAGHRRGVPGLAFTSDGEYLTSGSQDGTAIVWNVAIGQALVSLSGHGPINGLAVNPEGTRLASANRNGTTTIWDITTTGSREVLTIPFEHPALVTAGNFSHDRSRLVTISEDGLVKIRDSATSQVLLTTTLPITGSFLWVALSPDNTRLAIAFETTAAVWDLKTGHNLATMAGHRDTIYVLAFSPDGKRLATGGADMAARVWDAVTGRELLTLPSQKGPIYEVAFSPDGKHLAVASEDGTTKMWDTSTGQELRSFVGDTEVAFDPQGKRLATGSFDGIVRVWDSASGMLLNSLTGHMATVNLVSFSPDGKRLASASNDGSTKVWDVATGQELLTLTGHSGAVIGVAFSPDGKHLITTGNDLTFRIYTLDIEDLVDLTLSRLTRPLTALECQKYLYVSQCPPAP